MNPIKLTQLNTHTHTQKKKKKRFRFIPHRLYFSQLRRFSSTTSLPMLFPSLYSLGNNNTRYLGIWYKKTPSILVWIANWNNSLTDPSGVFTISNNGTLILLNQRNDTIWYSNSSRTAQNPIAKLLDYGNFVVIDDVTTSAESSVEGLWLSI